MKRQISLRRKRHEYNAETKTSSDRRASFGRLSLLGSVPAGGRTCRARYTDRDESGKRRPGILPSGRDAVDALVTVTDALGLRKLRAAAVRSARHTNALDVNTV